MPEYRYVYTSDAIPIVKATDLQAETAAKVAWTEARGEGLTGQLWVVQTIVNLAKKNNLAVVEQVKYGFDGYHALRYGESYNCEVYKEAKRIISGDTTLHNFHHFLNPATATNKTMLKLSIHGKRLGNHVFFNCK